MAGGSRGPQVLRLLLALLTIPAGLSDAQAQPEARAAVPERRARLVYVVAPDAEACPSAQELRAAANARAGHELFGEPASLTLQVKIRRDGASHVATVLMPDAPGGSTSARELRSDVGCAELATAVALVASIAIDPASILGPPAAAPPPSSASRTWRSYVGLGPRGAWGPVPLSGGLALSGGVVGARGTLGLELRGLAPRDVEYADGKVTVFPVTLAIVPCASRGPWEACGVAALGFVRGGGAGFAQDFSAWKGFGGLGARGGLVVGGDRLKLRAFAEAVAVFPRTTFLVGQTAAYTTRGVSLTAGVDVLLFF